MEAVSFKITSMEFSEALSTVYSVEYWELAILLEENVSIFTLFFYNYIIFKVPTIVFQLRDLFEASDIFSEAIEYVFITGFERGSVVVNFNASIDTDKINKYVLPILVPFISTYVRCILLYDFLHLRPQCWTFGHVSFGGPRVSCRLGEWPTLPDGNCLRRGGN